MELESLPHVPFPQREETMYLDTLKSNDQHAQHTLNETTRRGFYNPLEVDDIHGTKPKALHPDRQNKPHQHFAYDFEEGMKPSRLHPMEFKKPIVNGKPMNLTNDDIEGSKPRLNNWNFRRSTDPLNPEYNLPTFYPHTMPESKLTRDSLEIRDIEGARPKPLHTKWGIRDPINYSDVPGSTVGWKPHHKKIYNQPRDNIGCRDINGDGLFKSTRVTNPLSPRYRFDVPNDWESRPSTSATEGPQADLRPKTTPGHFTIGDVPGNHPKPLPQGRSVVYSLQCRDIEGTMPGWKPQQSSDEANRRHFRNTNYNGDIAGSYAGSLKRAFRRTRREFDTGRVVDPLNPDYDNVRRTTSLPPRQDSYRPGSETMNTYVSNGSAMEPNENVEPIIPASPAISYRSSGSRRSSRGGAPRPMTQGSRPPTQGSRPPTQGSRVFSSGAMGRAVQDIAEQANHGADILKITHSPPGTPMGSGRMPSHRSFISGGSQRSQRLMTPSESKMRAAREMEERASDIASVRSLQ